MKEKSTFAVSEKKRTIISGCVCLVIWLCFLIDISHIFSPTLEKVYADPLLVVTDTIGDKMILE